MFDILRNGEISLNSPLFITLFYQKFLEIGSGDFFYRLNVLPQRALFGFAIGSPCAVGCLKLASTLVLFHRRVHL
jgi:hypothetical protein